jgi:hypothetical protein
MIRSTPSPKAAGFDKHVFYLQLLQPTTPHKFSKLKAVVGTNEIRCSMKDE